MRTDIHRPSAIIPEDYSFVCVNYRDEEGRSDPYATVQFNRHMKKTGGKFSKHEHGGACMVCGAYMLDYAIFHHIPTNDYIRTGCDCANHIDNGHASAFRRVAQLRRAAVKRNAKVEACSAKLEALGILAQVECYFQPDDMFGAVRGCDVPQETNLLGAHLFGVTDKEYGRYYEQQFTNLIDMVRKLNKWGSLSDKQTAYLLVLCTKFADLPRTIQLQREANAKLPDAPTGKVEVTGEVVSIKTEEYQASYYTTVYTDKMTVKDDSGFKVYCTVPTSIDGVEVGQRVRFTVTPSHNDQKFGIGKRPSKATILESKNV